jgi:hypothetical protein
LLDESGNLQSKHMGSQVEGGLNMVDDLPRPTPEGKLIRRVRSLSIPKLSIPAAAARIGLSAEQWGYVERGYYPARDGNPPRPFSPPTATLAKMAHALRITPERLEAEGKRPDAAESLREILRDQTQDDEPDLITIANRSGHPSQHYELIERLASIQRELGSPINLEDHVEQALADQQGKAPRVIAAELREWRDFQHHIAKRPQAPDRDAG